MMPNSKKWFEEPECELMTLNIADIITTSDDYRDDEDWGAGEF